MKEDRELFIQRIEDESETPTQQGKNISPAAEAIIDALGESFGMPKEVIELAKKAGDELYDDVLSDALNNIDDKHGCLTDEDMVNNPSHYTWHPTNVDAIDIIEVFPHNIAAAMGYLWRAEHKGSQLRDLRKAMWHINREIGRLEDTWPATSA